MSCACLASISSDRADGAVAPRGRTARTCARARAASCRHAASLRSSAAAHFAEREIEHVVQQEGGPLERRQTVERQEQRNGQILGEFRAAVGRERCRVDNRLWQPGTDVLLTPSACRGQHVETNPRRRGHQKRARVRHVVAIGPMPAQVRLLHRVFGVSHRSKHAVGETEQAPAVWLEARGGIRIVEFMPHTPHVRRCGRSGPEPARREPCQSVPPSWLRSPPASPLPVPRPPSAVATTSPPMTRPIGPNTRATMAPRRPLPVPIRPAERARASPPMTAPISATTAAADGRDPLGGQGIRH